MKTFTSLGLTVLAYLALIPASLAQLAPANSIGVTSGHVHLNVPDMAQHQEIWRSLGGKVEGALVAFPGIYIVLTEAEPANASIAATAHHVGFAVQSYADYRAKLEAVGATFFFDNAEGGQILADLPGGVRVEFLQEADLEHPVIFHHMHLNVPDTEGLREWYVKVFDAQYGERRGLPSAIVPGGRVDFIPAGEATPLPSRGNAIDHIGFDVTDMDTFATRIEGMGIPFDVEPTYIESTNVTIAFITDPAGTFIEITEGLAGRE